MKANKKRKIEGHMLTVEIRKDLWQRMRQVMFSQEATAKSVLTDAIEFYLDRGKQEEGRA